MANPGRSEPTRMASAGRSAQSPLAIGIEAGEMVRCGPYPTAGPRGPLDRVAQIADRKYCRPHARPFRLRFARVVAVFPVCSPATLQAPRRPRPRALAAVNLAPAVRHGCRSAGLACPLGSSTAAGSSVRPNQGLKACPQALTRFALGFKGFIVHFRSSPRRRSPDTVSPATTACPPSVTFTCW
jgi:hypothetical protein